MSVSPALLRGPYETVIDVGAFRGDFAKACLAEWPECYVVSFEPLEERPADYGELAVTTDEHPTPRWGWQAVALGASKGTVTMHRNEFIPSSSVLPMAQLHRDAFPYTKRTEEVEVGMAMLDEFLELVQYPALLKIDVQGYELEVLRGATEVLTICTAVVLEVSHEVLYEGAATPAQLHEHLAEAGFTHKERVDVMYHPKDGRRALQSDELWVRA